MQVYEIVEITKVTIMDTRRTAYIFFSAVIAAAVSFYFSPFLDKTNNVISSIIDIYAILAAVLVAVISIIGDPTMLIPGGWRIGYVHAQQIQRRIGRFSHLFFLYLTTLFIAIIAMAVKDNDYDNKLFIYYIFTFVSVFSFLLSITLPYTLMKIQKDRMDEVIRKRKLEAE